MSAKKKPEVRVVLSYDAWTVLSWYAKNDRDMSVGTRREFAERKKLVKIGFLEVVEVLAGKERKIRARQAAAHCFDATCVLGARPTFDADREGAREAVRKAIRSLEQAENVCHLMGATKHRITDAGREFLKSCEVKVTMAGERHK